MGLHKGTPKTLATSKEYLKAQWLKRDQKKGFQ